MKHTQVDTYKCTIIEWNDAYNGLPRGQTDSSMYLVIYDGEIYTASYNEDGSHFDLEGHVRVSSLPSNDNSATRVTAWARRPRVPPYWK